MPEGISYVARPSTSFVMNKKEKLRGYRTCRKQPNSAPKCTSKRTSVLTSRDVYYLVVRYEQDRTNVIESHSQMLNSPTEEQNISMHGKQLESDKENGVSKSTHSLSNSKEQEGKIKDIGYSDDSFEDDRECVLRSAMTSHSDHLKEQQESTSKNHEYDNLEHVTETPHSRKGDSNEIEGDVEEVTSLQTDELKHVQLKSPSKENLQNDEENVLEELSPEEDQASQAQENDSQCIRNESIKEDQASQAQENDSQCIRNESIKEDQASQAQENDSQCIRNESIKDDLNERKSNDSNELREYRSDSIDERKRSFSDDRMHQSSQSERHVVIAGLPPRKPLVLHTTKRDPKKKTIHNEMQQMVHEILLRGDHKIKDLSTKVQNLRRDSEVLREENRALRKLQKLQGKEIAELDKFVNITTSTAKIVKRDVRVAETTAIGMDSSIRIKVKEIIELRQECERYKRMFELAHKIPRRSVLEERLEKAQINLESRDEEIEILNKKVVMQQKKISHERQKENKKFAQLDEEINGTICECDDIKIRLKDAERKVDKTNIYSRRSIACHRALPASQSLPALPWYPPVRRQKTSSKVKRWLNDTNNKHRK